MTTKDIIIMKKLMMVVLAFSIGLAGCRKEAEQVVSRPLEKVSGASVIEPFIEPSSPSPSPSVRARARATVRPTPSTRSRARAIPKEKKKATLTDTQAAIGAGIILFGIVSTFLIALYFCISGWGWGNQP